MIVRIRRRRRGKGLFNASSRGVARDSVLFNWADLTVSVPGVKWLLGREDVDVEARDESGYTPLVVAMSSGYADVVLALLASGRVDGMTRTDDGQSILHLALRAFEPSSPSLPLTLDAIRAKCEESIVHAETTELVSPIHFACM